MAMENCRSASSSSKAVKCSSKAKVCDTGPGVRKTACCRCGKRMFCRTKYNQPERTPSFKPETRYQRPESAMGGDTTYKMSYPGAMMGERLVPVIPRPNLTTGGEVSGHTTYKMSYPGWCGVIKPDPILPVMRKLLGDGPMQDETTQRHDYQPQPLGRMDAIKPLPNLVLSNRPFDDLTTMIASYLPPGPCAVPPESFAPKRVYKPSSTPLDDNTTHKMSFVPQAPPPKEDIPWARRAGFQPPCHPMECCTIYKTSFLAPGGSVEVCEPVCDSCECYKSPAPPCAAAQMCLG
ncbi:stabilizer of axonemal microtubules 2 isoform X2 [Bacillus rossius redtenbacheri]|uniref:stabilizer of axonemal microtubules 2 isoform X2 n=1 Tax=Bacillus rossius redtenbacheri TaxID=93214 RepID=UPI002FDEE0A5